MNRFEVLQRKYATELRRYDEVYNTCDKPIPFCGLYLYPILVQDYNDFFISNTCLLVDKNETVEGLDQSNLEFLLHLMQDPEEGKVWSWKLSRILELSFRVTNGMKCTHCNQVVSYADYLATLQNLLSQAEESQVENADDIGVKCPNCGGTEFIQMIRYTRDEQTGKYVLIVDGHTITARDFDLMRLAIMYQNLPDYYDDSSIDTDLKSDYKTRMRIQSKNAGKATLEKKIVCVSAASTYKIEELYLLPIRKFLMLLETIEDKMEYQALRTGMMSGLISLKTPPEHWIYKKEKDIMGDGYKDLDAFKQETQI